MRGLGGRARWELLVTTESCAYVPSAAPAHEGPCPRGIQSERSGERAGTPSERCVPTDLGGAPFSSVAQSCRLFATPWGGQAFGKTRVWSPSEPQTTAFRVPFFPFGGVSFHSKPTTPLRVPRSHGDPAARRENQGGLCPRCDRGSSASGHVEARSRAPRRQSAPPARRGPRGGGGRQAGTPWSQWAPEPSPANTDARMRAHTQAGASYPRPGALRDPRPPSPSSPGPPLLPGE